MAYNNVLAERIRKALNNFSDVEEKKMFGSLAFMVNGKLCVTAGKDRMMCRIDPNTRKEAIKKAGCSPVVMGDRKYNGYVYVAEEALQTKDDFDYWLELALDFNKKQHTK